MTKINSSINKNYGNMPLNNKTKAPQFTGKQSLTDKIISQLPNEKLIRKMKKADVLRGEAGGIIINSIGTGAVAPIFVAFNPFVKAPKGATEEQKRDLKNTTTYTAWRQPISAILAIIIQLGVQKPINIALDSVFNNKNLVSKNLWLDLDQSALNNDSYLKRQISKEMKSKNLHFASKEEFKKELDKLVNERKNQQINTLSTELAQNGQIKIGERTVESSKVAEILNKQIESYVDDARKLKFGEKGLNKYKEKATLLMDNRTDLENILGNRPTDEKKLTEYLKAEAGKATDKPELKKLLDELVSHPENLQESKCSRTLQRIKKIDKICGGKFTPEKYLERMLDTNKELDKLIVSLNEAKITDMSKVNEKTIMERIRKVGKLCKYEDNSILDCVLKNTETFQNSAEKLLTKIHKDVIKGYRTAVGSKYKGFNQIAKIIIGVAVTTPITCTALNWVYPRFMDIFFPKLSGSKKKAIAEKNGGEK